MQILFMLILLAESIACVRVPVISFFCHVFKEANPVANCLADMDLENGFGVEILHDPPDAVTTLLLGDIQRALSMRSSAITPRLVGP